MFSIGEFIGLLKHKIVIQNKLKYDIIQPSSLKMFIGKGNSNKTELFDSFMLSKLRGELEKNNKSFFLELTRFINEFNCDLKNIKSPLSDILDSLYMGLYLWQKEKLEGVANEN